METTEKNNSDQQSSPAAPAETPANAPAARKKTSLMRRIMMKLLAMLISFVVAILLIELLLRMFSPQTLAPAIEDSMFGVRCIRPGMSGRNCVPGSFDEYITTSPQRFRGNDVYQPVPPEGVFRIAMIGDSFTFGIGASDGADYPSRTKAHLLELAGSELSNKTLEVINAGCGGTGTGTQAIWFDKYVSQFHPSLVIISVNYGDVDEDNQLGIFRPAADGGVEPRSTAELEEADKKLARIRNIAMAIPGYPYLATHSHFVGWLRKVASGALWQNRASSFAAEDRGSGQAQSQTTEPVNKGIEIQAGELVWLNRKVQQSGARLAIVFLPVRDSIYPTTGPGADYARKMSKMVAASLRKLSAEYRIPFVDLTDRTREYAKTSPVELYHTGMDTHPNAAGYDFFGGAVADFILEDGLLNPVSPIKRQQ